jgi:hypothetical protein
MEVQSIPASNESANDGGQIPEAHDLAGALAEVARFPELAEMETPPVQGSTGQQEELVQMSVARPATAVPPAVEAAPLALMKESREESTALLDALFAREDGFALA